MKEKGIQKEREGRKILLFSKGFIRICVSEVVLPLILLWIIGMVM